MALAGVMGSGAGTVPSPGTVDAPVFAPIETHCNKKDLSKKQASNEAVLCETHRKGATSMFHMKRGKSSPHPAFGDLSVDRSGDVREPLAWGLK
jgi:hypothetical protein